MKAFKRQPAAPDAPVVDERWRDAVATLRQAAEELVQRRHAKPSLSQSPKVVPRPVSGPFDEIARSLDDPSPEVRKKAVRELYELDPDQAREL
jgi:hypothetical protein